MARKDRSYEDQARKFQDRADAAANAVQDHAEALARHTEDRLQCHMQNAKDKVRQDAHRRMETLHEAQRQFSELEKSEDAAQNFLAKSNVATVEQLSVGW